MKKVIIRIISMLLLLMTFLIIFGFSAQNGEESEGISGKVTAIIVKYIPHANELSIEEKQELIDELHPIIRKIAHFSIYAVVGVSIMSFLYTFSIKKKVQIGSSLLIGLLYAISDEFHQSFIPRQSSIMDRCLHRYSWSICRNTYYSCNCFYIYCIKRR